MSYECVGYHIYKKNYKKYRMCKNGDVPTNIKTKPTPLTLINDVLNWNGLLCHQWGRCAKGASDISPHRLRRGRRRSGRNKCCPNHVAGSPKRLVGITSSVVFSHYKVIIPFPTLYTPCKLCPQALCPLCSVQLEEMPPFNQTQRLCTEFGVSRILMNYVHYR